MLKLADLANRSDFEVGPLRVSPARRLVEGPAGKANLEPIVMKVFLLLLDADGGVVTRDELLGNAWGGVFVGDDSLNRAIARLRKVAAETAPGVFEIETVPRTGYRLVGTSGALTGPFDEGSVDARRWSRRELAGGALAFAALAGSGIWWALRRPSDPRVEAAIGGAESQIRNENFDAGTAHALDRAVAIEPDNAKAWGLLGLTKALLASGADPKDAPPLVDGAEKASRRALAIDPRQPDALLAMFELEGSTLDWITRDRRLREILGIAPNHFGALLELGELTAATGLVRESWDWNERALALEPLSLDFLAKRALKLWVLGRTAEADKVSDRLRALYPSQPWPWFVRAQIYAFTGRAPAAMAMLDKGPAIPPLADLWRASLPALAEPSPENLARARAACTRAAATSGLAANEAILIMSGLGDVDTAFAIADSTLLARGPLVPREDGGARQAAEDAGWRVNTQWMWVPPVAAMRANSRFGALCDGIGLTEYWRRRGVRPDYQLAGR
jgi:DNA-binding winged helix-turn-helix (wHTH) protein/tetratricopeptide (TPR) repeat protein